MHVVPLLFIGITCLLFCGALSEPKCGRPPPVERATALGDGTTEHKVGAVVHYECDIGFMTGGIRISSQCYLTEDENATWTVPDVRCSPRSCGDPGYVEHARRIGAVFTFPNKVFFECEEGYRASGITHRYCQASGTWSGRLPTCEIVSCGSPNNIENGRTIYSSLKYGSKLEYECNEGFILTNKQSRSCLSNGTWSGGDPECVEVLCEPPVAPEHGKVIIIGGKAIPGSIALFSCDEGIELKGSANSKCLDTGQWLFPAPECTVPKCGPPPPLERATVSGATTNEYSVGAVVNYECEMGFVTAGAGISSECYLAQDQTPTWTIPATGCIPRSCGDPGYVEHAHRIGSVFTFPNKVSFECEEGYRTSDIAHRYCQASGSWSGRLPTCKLVSCGSPEDVENGKVLYSAMTYGSQLEYECEKGFILRNMHGRSCLSNGTWSGSNPECVEVFCDPPVSPAHGTVILMGDKPSSGSIAVFSCDENTVLEGSTTSTCLDTGQWMFPSPKCIGGSVTENGASSKTSPKALIGAALLAAKEHLKNVYHSMKQYLNNFLFATDEAL